MRRSRSLKYRSSCQLIQTKHRRGRADDPRFTRGSQPSRDRIYTCRYTVDFLARGPLRETNVPIDIFLYDHITSHPGHDRIAAVSDLAFEHEAQEFFCRGRERVGPLPDL